MEDTAPIELKPCPFCGNAEPIINHIEPHKHSIATFMADHTGSYTIECGGCGLGFIDETRDQVIAAWNRRPEASVAPAELEDAVMITMQYKDQTVVDQVRNISSHARPWQSIEWVTGAAWIRIEKALKGRAS